MNRHPGNGATPNHHNHLPSEVPAGPVPLLDVSRGNGPLRDEMLAAVARVYDSGRFVLGPECEELERQIAVRCGTRHGVGCASGSDALLLALMACDVGPGDEVIVPSFTFFATASAVWRLGARPVFVDIDPATYLIDPARVEAAITPATRAVIPVHLFGQCADMHALGDIARRHGLVVIEDLAQAIGAALSGRPAGSMGHLGCLSFYPTKNLGGCGDGGLLVTSDDALADRLRLLRGHGMRPRYYHQEVGINSRLDTLQAAMLLVKLPHLSRWTAQRGDNAARYNRLLREAGLDAAIGLPCELPGAWHVWNQYTIRVPATQRDAVRQHLSEAGIGSEIYYPVPCHAQRCFESLGYGPGSLPHTEAAAREVISLPIFPELTHHEQTRVVHCLARFFQRAAIVPFAAA